jgi:Kef-type K+ transport system membrane component KefB
MTVDSSIVSVFLYLGVALLSARILGEIFERLKLSSIIGEILAGILFGGPLLFIINPEYETLFVDIGVLRQFSQIGIIILLFIIGLEVSPKSLRKTGKQSIIISLIEVTIALIGGFLTGLFLFKLTITQSIFFGTMFTATSIGVTVRTLNDIGKLNTRVGETLLSTAIFDDFIALFLVLIFSYALFPGSSDMLWYVTLILLVVLVAIIILLPYILRFLENRFRIFSDSRTNYFTLGIIFGVLTLLVFFAESLGISGAIIAFLFGLTIQNNKVLIGDIKDIFIKMGEGIFLPLFFFGVGATLSFDFGSFSPLLLLMIPIAILAKGLGTFAGSSLMKFSPKDSLRISIGMMPRAEIILVIAEIGLIQGIFNQSVYTMAVLLVFTTIILTPLLLRLVFRGPKLPECEYNEDDILASENGQTTIEAS